MHQAPATGNVEAATCLAVLVGASLRKEGEEQKLLRSTGDAGRKRRRRVSANLYFDLPLGYVHDVVNMAKNVNTGDPLIGQAVQILREKFETVDHYGPRQLVMFHDSQDPEQDATHARRSYELVQKLLSLL